LSDGLNVKVYRKAAHVQWCNANEITRRAYLHRNLRNKQVEERTGKGDVSPMEGDENYSLSLSLSLSFY
jgi:hypothetical protein